MNYAKIMKQIHNNQLSLPVSEFLWLNVKIGSEKVYVCVSADKPLS